MPFRLFDAATLECATDRLATPSDVVFAEVGCHGVSDAAALLLGGPSATLMVAKRKTANATAALAIAPAPVTELTGRPRGVLSLVGIGPGPASWRPPEVTRQVADAERWVEDGLASGSIREDVDPRSIAAQYVAHIAGLTYIWLLNPGDIDFARIHQDFIRTLRERLAA